MNCDELAPKTRRRIFDGRRCEEVAWLVLPPIPISSRRFRHRSLLAIRSPNGRTWGRMREGDMSGKVAPRLLTRWVLSALLGACPLWKTPPRKLSTDPGFWSEFAQSRWCLLRRIWRSEQGQRQYSSGLRARAGRERSLATSKRVHWDTHQFPIYLC